MKILALESSGLTAGIAVMEDDSLLAEYTVNYKKTHSQTLLPMLSEVAEMIELDLHSLDAIAVSSGPGSFTGLRIGSATAKGLALALDIPVVPVGTVDAMAYNLWGTDALVCPLMDARRGQVYTGIYQFEDGRMETLVSQCAVDIGEILERINRFGKRTVFLGDVEPFLETLREKTAVSYDIAPPRCRIQRAASVACLGAFLYREGKVQKSWEHHPEYLRLSQAERERKHKQRDFTV